MAGAVDFPGPVDRARVTGRLPLRLVATDLDGTLLGEDGRISAENVDGLRRAHGQGVVVVVATGRPTRWLDVLDVIAELDPIVLASNGAVRWDLHHRRMISVDELDADLVREVMADMAAADPTTRFMVEQVDTFGWEPGYPLRDIDARGRTAERDELPEGSPVVKLLARSASLASDDYGALMASVVAHRCELTWSGVEERGLLEISARGVNKASGLRVVLEDLGIDPAQVAAFGDMPNDLDMLDLVGHPHAMADAHPLLVERGYLRAGPHDESGVGRAVLGLLATDR